MVAKKDSIGIGLMGLGVIGSGTAKVLMGKPDTLAREASSRLVLKKVLEQDLSKHGSMGIEPGLFTTQFAELVSHPEVDIVLSDIVMPGLDGWQLVEKIKARFPLLTVILYSGYPSALKQKPDGTPPPDNLLQKPFKMNQLVEIINTISRQRL